MQDELPRVLKRILDQIQVEFGDRCVVKTQFPGVGRLPGVELVPTNPRAASVWVGGWNEGIMIWIADLDMQESALRGEDSIVAWAVDLIRRIAEFGVVQTELRVVRWLPKVLLTDPFDGERMAQILRSKETVIDSREPW